MVAAEIMGGISGLKAAFDIAKGLKNIDDATRRNAAVIELQEKILGAQQTQSALVERVGDLEKQVASFEKWEAEKERYYLQEIYPRNFAYAINENARGSQPPHLICATCYESHKKSILQQTSGVHLGCSVCNSRVQFKDSRPSGGATFGRGGF
jgi:hypothetical protein